MNEYESNSYLNNNAIKATTRYIELLANTQERVSPQKLASRIQCYTSGNGFIDKLECFLNKEQQTTLLMKKWDAQRFKYQGVRLKDKRLYLEVSVKNQAIHLYMGHQDNPYIRKFFLNPSKFSNISEMLSILESVLGIESFNSNILRIDYTVDLPVKYIEVLKGLNIENKRKNSEFLNGSIRSGLVVGGSDDKIKIYDKATHLGIQTPLTRIERQTSGKKIIVKTIGELQSSLNNIIKFKPFNTIKTNHLYFLEGEATTDEQVKKFTEFKTLIEHEGYFLTKKKLTKNRNFERDYGKFFLMIPYKKQPSHHFEIDIKKFFQGGDN